VGDRVLVLQLGTYAEYMVAKEAALVKLPGDQPFDRMVMAQQLGVTLYAMERFWPDSEPGRVATIIGAGPIGLFFLQLARMWGFEQIVVSDPEPSRLAAAKKLGATVTIQSSEQSVVEATHEISNGKGADLVIEAAGLDSARSQAIECVRTYGRIGYFGYPEASGMAEFPYNTAFWKGPISIEFVINAQGVAGLPHFHKAVDLIATGKIEVDYLLGQEFSLPEIDEAFKAARNRQFIKVQVVS
jgi:L-iditol 2-dehydrogenase